LYIEVDEIYHLASPASPPHYMYNPVKTIKTNTLGTINMLGRLLIAFLSVCSVWAPQALQKECELRC
jgi:GDP-D-mannose dehydratase